ncbi:P-loop containing nucleoside triphosphate hydrolase protein [Hyaloraphidium curvatum]|nr:P-loop containing nucleoside triphosphate hydrolase protein [Hyaloraphidium curvatum]
MPPKKAGPAPPAARFGRVRSNLRMGVVGLPNVGKSSLFNLLCDQSAAASNFPFCTIDPNESRCPVPDARYDYLCELWKPPSTYPPYLHVTDIAGLIRGASTGAGLGNAFLSHIQAVDGYFHVVRAFDNSEVVHVDDTVDPVRDLDTIQTELCLKDLETAKKAIEAEEVAVKKSQGKFKLSPTFLDVKEKVLSMLEKNVPVRAGEWNTGEVELINEKMRFITTKPCVYLVNLSKDDFLRKKNKWLPKIKAWIDEKDPGATMLPFSIEFEQELWNLRGDAEGTAALVAQGVGAPAASMIPRMVTVGFSVLNLIYFFTAGEKEVRAWTVYNGATAPEAAGCIHSDFERGFIKAEVCAFQDFKDLSGGQKSMAAVKAAGKYRIEGKAYVVQSGDIVHFQFNVTSDKKK